MHELDGYSLDYEHKNDDGTSLTILDTLGVYDEYNSENDEKFLIKTIYSLIKTVNKINGKPSSWYKNLPPIIEGIKAGFNQTEIAERLGITRQGVSIAIRRFATHVKEYLIKIGYVHPWIKETA